MITKTVKCTFWVDVTVDETKFSPEWMKDFESYMFPADLDDHFEHLAQLKVREMLDIDFVEGYGDLKDMGISASVIDSEQEIM